MEQYDAIIVGSGLGGLASAVILGKEGLKVLVLEKNNQFGGNLQTFARNKTIFDTGVHYIGALDKGQNLYNYFQYLGIANKLPLVRMSKDGYDVISFDNDPIAYPHAQGYANFVQQLIPYFPEEKRVLEAYIAKLQQMCNFFPLYNLSAEEGYDTDILALNAKAYLDELTPNEKLKAVLAGSAYLYAGDGQRSPLYVHALSVNSYIESAWKVLKGGSQITKALVTELKKYNVTLLKRQEAESFILDGEEIVSVKTKGGKTYFGEIFISNIELKNTLKMVGEGHFKKSFVNRINRLEPIVASFALYLVFKPGTFKYMNYNVYHHKDYAAVWDAQFYKEEEWPKSFMASMGVKNENDEWAESMTCMTYMRYEELKPWEDTFNTVVNKGDRGVEYAAFLNQKAEVFLQAIEKRFPGIRSCISAYYTSSPLSYRDYIGGQNGNMYGYVKDSNQPMLTFISPKSKVGNLFFTGQSVNMHGILGVTIGAIATCSEILGKKYLLDKIHEELAMDS